MTRGKVNSKNLKLLCWKRGVSVAQFCRKIGKGPTLVWRAVKHPRDYPAVYLLVERELHALSE